MTPEIEGRLLLLWGKTFPAEPFYHPVLHHMLDSGAVADGLLSERASPRWRQTLSYALGTSPEALSACVPAMVALHDIGKISEAFQRSAPEEWLRLTRAGFSQGRWLPAHDIPHAILGMASLQLSRSCLESLFSPMHIDILVQMVGGHHGRFCSASSLQQARRGLSLHGSPEWKELRETSVRQICMVTGAVDIHPQLHPPNISAAIMLLTGFSILCDWVASGSYRFSPAPGEALDTYWAMTAARAIQALDDCGFLMPVVSEKSHSFASLFPNCSPPRPLQEAIDKIPVEVLHAPCLAIIEAPTGEGKTEAALALAQRIGQASGSHELYYALPTMATSNQMFLRLARYLENGLQLQAGIKLVHGQAMLIEDDLRKKLLGNAGFSGDPQILDWFAPKKHALLAPFGVGTVDQAELAALNTRHAALRMVGLAGKIIIIDEVHAYDVYMTTIIERLLNWLAAMRTSVIVLSATLPSSRRNRLMRAFHSGAGEPAELPSAYPSLLILGPGGIEHATPPAYQTDRVIALKTLSFGDDQAGEKASWLLDSILEGGCACWITNTVARAQRLYAELKTAAPPEVELFLVHARFPLEVRSRLEEAIAASFGPRSPSRPARAIVIGTQVLEQSLDLDFDLMVSDLAPIDLLLQRAGRLHRHTRPRPAAHGTSNLWVNIPRTLAAEPDLLTDAAVYDEYILRTSLRELSERGEIRLPADYRPLIETVYDEKTLEESDDLWDSQKKLRVQQSAAREQALLRLLPPPTPDEAFTWAAAMLEFEENEHAAGWIVAQTRLAPPSLTVIPLEKRGPDAVIPHSQQKISLAATPSRKEEFALMRAGLRVSHKAIVSSLGQQNTSDVPLFSSSSLLKDYSPLWLDDGSARLSWRGCDYRLKLDPELGLVIERQGGETSNE